MGISSSIHKLETVVVAGIASAIVSKSTIMLSEKSEGDFDGLFYRDGIESDPEY